MKRFFLKVLSILFLIFCIFGGILAAAGFDDGNTGMVIAGCIIATVMLLFFFLCLRKSKNHRESVEVAPEESSPTNPRDTLSDKFGIDYVVNVGRKRSVYIMMVHYKSGKVKRVRTRFDSLEFRHYAKYIKQ